MQPDDWNDRITDVFLAEAVSGTPPPDLRERIRERAASRRRARRARRALLAAAASFALAAGLWLAWPDRPEPVAYPAPAATGACTVLGGGPVSRGAVLTAEGDEAGLVLGGYVRVAMKPETTVVVAGSKNAEELVLERGEIECDVEVREGCTFSVQTEVGTVSVMGTRFTVQMEQEEDRMSVKSMAVKVMVGSVVVTALGAGPAVLHAGERRVGPGRRPGRDRDRPVVEAIEGAETPQEKAQAAYALLERALEAQRREIELKVLQDPEVAAALKAWQKAAATYTKEVNDHPEYSDLKKAREATREDFRKLMTDLRGQGRDEWRKRRDEFTKLRERSAELRGKMTKLAGSVPRFVELKQKRQDALETFLTTYQEKLKANEDYVELGKQLEEVEALADQVEEQLREQRRQAWRERRDRGDRRRQPRRDRDNRGGDNDDE
jgi:hypothetical protein